tara:strand:- start:560 stop:2278 length:1719 start_codon:yes stop_codon:yes gene_type:complete
LYLRARVIEVAERRSRILNARLFNVGKQTYASLYPYQAKKIKLKEINSDFDDLDLATIEVMDWREGYKTAYAKLVKVISQNSDPISDYLYIADKHGILELKKHFENIKPSIDYEEILANNIEGRIDLTDLKTFTIDPVDAKDFDDAISVTKNNGCIDLYVHIADVSAFIGPEDETDAVARKLGNSYYFDEETLHMLPEELSTNFLSLKPGVKRLAFSVKIRIDEDLNIKEYKFFESVINSDKRLTYQDAEELLKSKTKNTLNESLHLLLQLTKSLKEQRLSTDGFDMNYEDYSFKVDDKDSSISVQKNKRLKSHMIVEECMLLANKLASEKMLEYVSVNKLLGIYRNHESPSSKSINFIEELMGHFSQLPSKKNLYASDINNFLNRFKSKSNYDALCVLIMRKMQKANYSSKCTGHYGLGFSNYVHFTSPIRRYSDLMVHRILKGMKIENHDIIAFLKDCNEGEIRSQQAERDYHKLKSLRWLNSVKGKILKGHIIDIKRSKIGVRESCTGFMGYISKRTLPIDDYLIYRDKMVMKGVSGGLRFEIGGEVAIKIDKIDMISQEVLFKLLLNN